MVVEASVPKGFKVTFPYPSEEAQPRCGVILVSVKRFKNPRPWQPVGEQRRWRRVHYVILTSRPLKDSTVVGWPEKIVDQPT